MVPIRRLTTAAIAWAVGVLLSPAATLAGPGTLSATPAAAPGGVTPATTPASLRGWSPDVAAAKDFALAQPGRVRFHVLDQSTGRTWDFRGWEKVNFASTLKPLLMATYLRSSKVRDRALTAADRDLLRPMIRLSANTPASTLVVRLGQDAIARTAKAADMGTVLVSPHWGTTQTTARAQVALFSNFPELFPTRHREYAMQLLSSIAATQQWGIGQVEVPGRWKLYFKGGWGSGTGAVDHQTALLQSGERRLILSITTTGNPSHKRGKVTLKGVAQRLLRNLPE
ncbi:MAG: serine hydrolase [Solirubrobacteraceae bacterium]|nr:serine hydrolase [Solirubrobacteraceae bacterium]